MTRLNFVRRDLSYLLNTDTRTDIDVLYIDSCWNIHPDIFNKRFNIKKKIILENNGQWINPKDIKLNEGCKLLINEQIKAKRKLDKEVLNNLYSCLSTIFKLIICFILFMIILIFIVALVQNYE